MKCKHENADHLMPGMFSMMMDGSLIPTAQCEQFRCIDCGAWLSLGESNDADPAVQLELRAAGLAQNERDHGFREWNGYESLGWCSPEAEHAPLIERDIAEGRGDRYPRDLADYYAGHLAGEILADHDTQHPASTGGEET